MIIDRKFEGTAKIGAESKYDFKSLKAGQCLVINPIENIRKEKHRITCAISQYKKYHDLNWTTAVRMEDDKILVYRID